FKAADPGPDTLNAKPGEKIDIMRGYWAFSLQNEFEKSSGSLKLFYNFGEHDITDGFHSKDHNYGINFYESLKLFEGNNITLGFDHINFGGMAENLKARNGAGIVFADTAMTETGVYGFVQQTLAGNLTLNAGLRFQNHSIYGNQWIPSAGFAYNFNKLTTWKGSISKGYRSPTIRELFMWGTANPTLNPETILNYETGVLKTFMNKKLRTELTLFVVTGDNLITSVPVNGTYKFMNSGEISNKGIELAVDATPLDNLVFNATYSYIHMKNPVYATPEHHIYLSATYRIKKLQLNASIQQIANLDNDATFAFNPVDYSVVQAKAFYSFTKNIQGFVSADNLFNREYEVNRYYTMPGTTVFGGINFRF
ncbi:MAG: TonB-dependent receptor, partial [Bacteroidia bacterium]|nr:TonB-dependent receptor [Bacteroidia bacterium]